MNEKGQCPRILVVEDDRDQRQLLCEALSLHYEDRAGRNIVGVADARQCLAQDLGSFDVVLLDYHLPDMPGLALLDRIVARADLPVIFVTGDNDGATAAEAINRGAQDFIVKLGDYLFAMPALVEKSIRQYSIKRDNERLRRQLEATAQELQGKNRQLQESLAQVRTLATTDSLTHLANRRKFVEVLERYYGEALRYNFDLTCCMCDLDHYKDLNDALGHQAGDEVLVIAADVIRSSLRGSDIAARYGGDEFILLLPHTSLDRGLAVGERIRHELVLRTRGHAKVRRAITMSVGIASLGSDHPDSPDALVRQADQALYAAKERGKDRLVTFESIGGAAVRS
jgi:diguanylate cyclase (GGDEF)-like protein